MKRTRYLHRKRNGNIRIPAVITLCLAASLLVFSRLDGEQKAQELLDALADNNQFITRALTLELGLFSHDTETFVPRTAAVARNEEAETPVAESAYVPLAIENDSPVLSSVDPAATVTINNETSYDVNVSSVLAEPYPIRKEGDGPQVLIFHTHGSESYTPDAAFPYTPIETERTTDVKYNVVRVGDELQKVLAEQNIESIHIREIFDSPVYSGSYDRSLAAIEEVLAEHPAIQVVIDVHRDSILTDDGRTYKTECTIDGETMAQLMFVVGTDDGGLEHPNWRNNLSYVAGLQYQLNRLYPGLMRPINLRTQRFNQHARPGSILIEVGSSGNTMTEALAAIRLWGDVLAADLNGEKKQEGQEE